MQFLTYESTHEHEVRRTMSIMQKIEDIDNDNFITTIQHINYAAIIMSYNHRKKLNDHAKNFTRNSSQFLQKYTEANEITEKQHNPS